MEWLSTADAVSHYGVSSRTLRNWAMSGRIMRHGSGRAGAKWELRDDLLRDKRGRKANAS